MSIAIIFDVSEHVDNFMEHNAPISAIFFDYYKNFILFYGNLFSPLLTFLAVIFFTSQLASRTEIVAILSSGVSFRRFLRPYIVGATILALLSFYLNNFLVPKANKDRLDFETSYIYTYRKSLDMSIHKQLKPGEMIYFDKYNNRNQVGYQFTYEIWDGVELKEKLFANYIKWDTTIDKWRVENYYLRKWDAQGKETLIKGTSFDTAYSFTPEEFVGRLEDVQMMDVNELDVFIEEEKMKGSPNVPFYLVEKHNRNALPFSTYILTIIGVSMSSRKVRGGIGAHIAAGLALAVIYILAMKVTTVYAMNAGLDPIIAVWIPNLIYGVIAAVLYQRAPK